MTEIWLIRQVPFVLSPLFPQQNLVPKLPNLACAVCLAFVFQRAASAHHCRRQAAI